MISRILVPVDFSVHSEKAFRYAKALATRFGALVELLHVVEDPYVSGAWSSEAMMPNLPELLNELVADARGRLEKMRSAAADNVTRIDAVVARGEPASTIVDHATTGRFDLVVMGTHGRAGLAHVFMGSVAERVVRRAPCPVVTLRDTGAETSTPAAKAVA